MCPSGSFCRAQLAAELWSEFARIAIPLLKSALGSQSFHQAEHMFEAYRFGEYLGYIQISGP
ncbi:MAG TPA: hypothetical protein VJU61_01690, partial [Polyangiaceae bacterium]|nr:hypothetical protein [Polyangiaceae bacterium]